MINKALNRIKFANHANLNDLIINQEQNQRCANIYFCIAEKKMQAPILLLLTFYFDIISRTIPQI